MTKPLAHSMSRIEVARRGGKARARSLTPERRQAIAAMAGGAHARLDREGLLQILREIIPGDDDEGVPVEALMETETFRRAALTRRQLLWRLRGLQDEGIIDLDTMRGASTFIRWHRDDPLVEIPKVVTDEDALRMARAALLRIAEGRSAWAADPHYTGRFAEYYVRRASRTAKLVIEAAKIIFQYEARKRRRRGE